MLALSVVIEVVEGVLLLIVGYTQPQPLLVALLTSKVKEVAEVEGAFMWAGGAVPLPLPRALPLRE